VVGGSTYFRTHPLVLVSLFKGLASAAWYHCTPLPLTSQAQSPPASSALLPLPPPRLSKPRVNPRVAPLPTKKRSQWFSDGWLPRIHLYRCTDIYAERAGGAGSAEHASRGARKAKVPTDVFFNY
jgi:hypothetical protein